MLFRSPKPVVVLALGLAALVAAATAAQPVQPAEAAAASGGAEAPAVDWVQPLSLIDESAIAALSPDGDELFASALDGTAIEAVDVATHAPIGFTQIPVESGGSVESVVALAASSSGVLYSLDQVETSSSSHLDVVRIDPATGTVTGRVDLPSDCIIGGNESRNFFLSGDGSDAYLFCSDNLLETIDTTNLTLAHSQSIAAVDVSTVAPDGDVWGSWSQSGSEVFGLIDPATGEVVSLSAGGRSIDGAVLPDQTQAVSITKDTANGTYDVALVTLADGTSTPVAQVPVAAASTAADATSADGTTVVLEQQSSSGGVLTASSIDLATGAVSNVGGLSAISATIAPVLLSDPAGGFVGVGGQAAPSGAVFHIAATADAPPPLLATSAPTLVAASLQVGKTATIAAAPNWAATPDALTYQWYDNGAQIAGATNATLPLAPQLEGSRVSVVVSASLDGYALGTVASDPGTGWVGDGTLAAATPTIAGKAAVGSTLTASPGTWTSGTVFTYQWSAGGDAIPRATSTTFTVTSAQEGKRITVRVTGRLPGYAEASSTSAVTAAVPSVAYRPSAGPALAGADRYGTAIAVSKNSYPVAGSAKTVVITSGENFPDALSAAPVAVKLGGPLLLTQPDKLPSAVAAEVKRLGPKRIVVVGGPSAVSAGVLTSLNRIAPTVRVSGSDRYATSLAVAKYAFGSTNVPSVYFATGASFADALSASAAAGAVAAPVVLVPPTAGALSSQLRAWLIAAHATSLNIVGGTSALSYQTQNAILSVVGQGSAYAGTDRFDTNRLLNASVPSYPGRTTAYLASGLNFPDALAGAAAAAKADEPLYLVDPGCVPTATVSALKAAGISRVIRLGGASALSPSVASMKACTG